MHCPTVRSIQTEIPKAGYCGAELVYHSTNSIGVSTLGASQFDDLNIACPTGFYTSRLSALRIMCGKNPTSRGGHFDALNGLQAQYEIDGGRKLWGLRHFGSNIQPVDTSSHMLELRAGEYITGVFGEAGEWMAGISFRISNGRVLHYCASAAGSQGSGQEHGVQFDLGFPTDQVFGYYILFFQQLLHFKGSCITNWPAVLHSCLNLQ
jgi:hypothetical protein